MCGRFTLAIEDTDLAAEFEGVEFPSTFAPRYNIAPSQPVLAIPNIQTRAAEFFIWGLIPTWAKDASIGNRLINARAETLGEKPAFRGSYKYKRCLILADGFYEWKAVPGSKTKIPHFIGMADERPFSFAGLWSEWRSPEGSELRTCTIVTTTSNSLVAAIHDRMPVIIAKKDREQWLDPSARSPEDLAGLLKPFPADLMRSFPVSARVNSPANDDPQCREPV